MNTSLLSVEGLSKDFKYFTFGTVDFHVEIGTVVALIGENGSGKSTLFRLLLNILHADEGKITFFGEDRQVDDAQFKQSVGYAGNLLDAFPYISIKELSHMISYWYDNWNEDRYRYFCERYAIDERMKFGRCSTGIKKKVEFILSICHNPKLLILDEPSSGVDIKSQRKMKEDIIEFMEDGTRSTIIATHSVDEITHLSDILIVLHDGKIVNSMNKDDIYENWARVWVSDLKESIINHTNTVDVMYDSKQIITNHLPNLEQMLTTENITITHTQSLKIGEVIDYLIPQN
ncbi:ATP-binding cassette domain-containing protein [Aquibacillus rhizosphaerae]|uniref:ABC transporter ATP-binding protein n=1 Tax=Aquibacillus rhizosphaerae TaxID=3051431 RepID=A0ABT7L886_9BACI|nr:ABC transporter ATP-binding protein [Aquibacillus sp. LR5S19]MDL4842079.1 ABC transporter ATP-binding protein [Aquibacillus sp. LR5S19]